MVVFHVGLCQGSLILWMDWSCGPLNAFLSPPFASKQYCSLILFLTVPKSTFSVNVAVTCVTSGYDFVLLTVSMLNSRVTLIYKFHPFRYIIDHVPMGMGGGMGYPHPPPLSLTHSLNWRYLIEPILSTLVHSVSGDSGRRPAVSIGESSVNRRQTNLVF